jgi:hypothetical protein
VAVLTRSVILDFYALSFLFWRLLCLHCLLLVSIVPVIEYGNDLSILPTIPPTAVPLLPGPPQPCLPLALPDPLQEHTPLLVVLPEEHLLALLILLDLPLEVDRVVVVAGESHDPLLRELWLGLGIGILVPQVLDDHFFLLSAAVGENADDRALARVERFVYHFYMHYIREVWAAQAATVGFQTSLLPLMTLDSSLVLPKLEYLVSSSTLISSFISETCLPIFHVNTSAFFACGADTSSSAVPPVRPCGSPG